MSVFDSKLHTEFLDRTSRIERGGRSAATRSTKRLKSPRKQDSHFENCSLFYISIFRNLGYNNNIVKRRNCVFAADRIAVNY